VHLSKIKEGIGYKNVRSGKLMKLYNCVVDRFNVWCLASRWRLTEKRSQGFQENLFPLYRARHSCAFVFPAEYAGY